MSNTMWISPKGPPRLWDWNFTWIIFVSFTVSVVRSGNELWPLDRPTGMPNINSLEVMCGKDHMDVHMSFSHPFEGIVSSKGQHSDPRCVYVPPSTGKNFFSFRIAYGRCGTKPDLHGQFYENTIVVQYDKDLLEVWDEAKRLRCEWFNDYEKTASKPPMVIADLDVIQLDFRGDNVDCWMEIQHGKGPWAPPVSGIVPLGSTLTLVVAINDYKSEFDMRVKSCVASDGVGHIIKLTDEYGCVLRPKMISRFLKARAPNEKSTVITYAFFHAFKFPDALSVHIKCKVEICRNGCLDHCQLTGSINERKDTDVLTSANQKNQQHNGGDDDDDETDTSNELMAGVHPSSENSREDDVIESKEHDAFYDELINGVDKLPSRHTTYNGQQAPQQQLRRPAASGGVDGDVYEHEQPMSEMLKKEYFMAKHNKHETPGSGDADDQFPHGPRQLEAKDRIGLPSMAGPRSLDLAHLERQQQRQQSMFVRPLETNATDGASSRVRRVRRTVSVSDRHARSADVGVSGLYEVISEADLAFSPETKQEAVTVFQGKITEDIVYGICMPVPGFSVLFIVVASSAIISALVAGSLLYRYQMQKDALALATGAASASAAEHHNNTIASWMTLRLFGMRQQQQHCNEVDIGPTNDGHHSVDAVAL